MLPPLEIFKKKLYNIYVSERKKNSTQTIKNILMKGKKRK